MGKRPVYILSRGEEGEKFLAHNYRRTDGGLQVESLDPHEVLRAFQDPRSVDPQLIATLQCTLSPEVCHIYLQQAQLEGVAERDYYLSRLHQFLVGVHASGAQDPFLYFELSNELWLRIVAAFENVPDSELERLTGVDWPQVFLAYHGYPIHKLPERLLLYTPKGAYRPIQRGRLDRRQFVNKRIKQLGTTQEKVALDIGVPVRTFKDFLNGSNINFPALKKIAEILGCTADDLI